MAGAIHYWNVHGHALKEVIDMSELKTGIKCTKELTVTEDVTAAALDSGGLAVYATPAMIALMEFAAWDSVEACMEEGRTTVGTLMNVKHLTATTVGMHVKAESELVEIDRRRLVFKVAAYDDAGLIGEGTHERFIIDTDRFMSAAEANKQ